MQNRGIVKEDKGEEHVCAVVHYEPAPSSIPEEEIQLGSGLTEEKRQQVLFVFFKASKIFS